MKRKILDRAGDPLYEIEAVDVRNAVEQAVRKGVNLMDANLRGANLLHAYLVGADLMGACLQDADLRGAILGRTNLYDADLRGANLVSASFRGTDLRGADLRGARLSWGDHTLLAEILWRAADTESRQMLAAYVGRRTDWCWDNWRGWEHPDRAWAIGVLAGWAQEGDGAPDWILEEETLARDVT